MGIYDNCLGLYEPYEQLDRTRSDMINRGGYTFLSSARFPREFHDSAPVLSKT